MSEYLDPQIAHIGVNFNRAHAPDGRNELEKRFAEEWVKENTDQRTLLANLLNKSEHELTPREAEVAATVIQWLGSNVGQHFLETVQAR